MSKELSKLIFSNDGIIFTISLPLPLFPFPFPWDLITHVMSSLQLGNPGLSQSGISQYLHMELYFLIYYTLGQLELWGISRLFVIKEINI